jgi:polysaccharide export outer membrane protein
MKRYLNKGIIVIAGLGLLAGLGGCALAPGLKEPGAHSVHVASGEDIPVIPMRVALQQGEAVKDRAPTAQPPKAKPSPYRIGKRDVLAIIVWNHSTLGLTGDEAKPQVFEVGPDGRFYYPYAGTILAEGKTVEELRRELVHKLVRYVKSPQVSVSIYKYQSRRVFILGQVAEPGVVPLTGYPLTFLEAIAMSGGFTETASRTRAYLTRDGVRYEIQLNQLIENGNISQNYVLKDGDILHIPDNSAEKVFVLGAVRQPSTVFINGGRLTLSEAIAETGGLDQMAANARHIYVIRGDFAKPTIYHLDMRDADALLLGDQFVLLPRDVIYVSDAGISRWNKVLNLILPNLQTIFYLDSLGRR